MSLVMILWTVSLVAEFGLLTEVGHTFWRRAYPKFLTYLLFDWTASLFVLVGVVLAATGLLFARLRSLEGAH